MERKREKVLRQIPNALSALRLVCTFGLLFAAPMKTAFFILYSVCGVSDVLDGFLARKMRCTSELGAVLDSIADLSFYTMMILRLFPILWKRLDVWVWIFGACVVLIRLIAYGVAALKYHRFASVHTYLNKATGLVVFSIPYFIAVINANIICTAACVVGGLASLEEVFLHLTSKRHDENRKSIFMKPAA